jgi:short-subunit dehydrogenase
MTAHSLAVVTGAAVGVGLELGRLAASQGFDLILVDEHPFVYDVGASLRARGARVDVADVDLATPTGADRVIEIIADRNIDALLITTSAGSSRALLDQPLSDMRRAITRNVTASLQLIHDIGRGMRDRAAGRILVTGALADAAVRHHAVFHAARAFLDLLAFTLRAELKGTGVTVTSLMAPPASTPLIPEIAELGFNAMMRGESDVATEWERGLRTALRLPH